MADYFIGLMSGTSLDAIDAVLVDFHDATPRLMHAINHPLDAALRADLLALCQPGANEIERLGKADVELGETLAVAVDRLLDTANIPRADITAIGSHGQTVRHQPNVPLGFTLQIGDPNRIAEITGITTVADFRRRDLAAGGQGAPLVPAFHNAVFRNLERTRVILNIGGMANITLLPKNPTDPVLGFDTGPGNVLMDAWVHQHKKQSYDADGQWAASGQVDNELLALMLEEPFFLQPPPKSTGRELFNNDWLHRRLTESNHSLSVADVQATLCELTAITIAEAITSLVPDNAPAEVLVCGGGARNSHLRTRLQANLTPHRVALTDELGIAAEWVEACAFAWLAKQTLARKPGNVPEVTGARHPVVLGAIYPA